MDDKKLYMGNVNKTRDLLMNSVFKNKFDAIMDLINCNVQIHLRTMGNHRKLGKLDLIKEISNKFDNELTNDPKFKELGLYLLKKISENKK